MEAISSKIMMQRALLCTLRVYCTKYMVEWQPLPLLVDFEFYPTPGESPIHPIFTSKRPQKMPGQLLKYICIKIERFRMPGKNLEGVVTLPPPLPLR